MIRADAASEAPNDRRHVAATELRDMRRTVLLQGAARAEERLRVRPAAMPLLLQREASGQRRE